MVENLKLDDDLKMFPKKFTYPPELTPPYIYQQQIIVGLLDLDKIPAPESAIVSIGTEFRGIGKSYLMGMMKAHLQGYALTLDPKIDFKEIEKRRGEPDEWGLFNERPLLYFDISKNEKKVVGDKVSFGTYFEDLSSGDKCGGRWNDSSRPLIIFIGNDHLKIESLGGFSGHRVHFYSIMSVGASFPNAQGITDFENYKLVVSKDMMAKIGKVAEEQVYGRGTPEFARLVRLGVSSMLTTHRLHPRLAGAKGWHGTGRGGGGGGDGHFYLPQILQDRPLRAQSPEER